MNTCKDCRHFHTDPENSTCRRFPPQVTVVGVPTQGIRGVQIGMQPISAFPSTSEDASCGEFVIKLKMLS